MFPALNWNYWILQSVAMGVTALLLPKLRITSVFGAFGMVVALAMVNAHLWDAALFFYVPDNFSTQTLLLLAANAFIFWTLVKILPGIEIQGFIIPLVAPTVFTITSSLIHHHGSSIDVVAYMKEGVKYAAQARDYFLASGETKPAETPK